MRIISKTKDYYDAVMKTGMDREVVYVRDTKEIELPSSFGIDFSTEETGNYYHAKLRYLGYCGQIFRIIDLKYTVQNQYHNHALDTEHRKVFFDFNEFKEFMITSGYGNKRDFDQERWWPTKYTKFNQYETSKLLGLFHEYQTPLFLISNVYRWREKNKTTMTLGPSLKDLEFYRFKDAYTTYQDIFQYVSGTLNRPENKMVEIADKYKIAKHGFDKHSFRKMPTKKK